MWNLFFSLLQATRKVSLRPATCVLGVRHSRDSEKGAAIDRFPSQSVTSTRPIAVSLLQALSFVYTCFFRFSCGLRTYILRSSGEPQLTIP